MAGRVEGMCSVWLFLVVLLLVGPVALAAAEEAGDGRVGLTVAPVVEFMWGSTDYELDANAFDPSAADSVSRIRSRLEFPLDVVLVGGDAAYGFGDDRLWKVETGVRLGVTDPSELMTDEDWIDGFPVSYTESDAEASVVMVSGKVSRRLSDRDGPVWWVFVGFDYQKIEQDIVGFDGWQDLDRNGVRSPVRGDDPAIDYEVTYMGPTLGATMALEAARGIDVDVTLTSGLLFASDRDDHLLRGWVGEGDGIGVLIDGDAMVRYRPPVLDGHLWLGVSGGLRYDWADGDVTKTWYRDVGSIAAGTVDADIPYTFESLQPSLGLHAGWSF